MALLSDILQDGAEHKPCEPLADVAQTYDLIASQYDSLWNGPLAFAENHTLFRRLLDHGLIKGHVLDLGCGTGLLLDWCKEWLPPSCYVGLDVSMGMVTQARRKHPGYTFQQFDLDTQEDEAWGKLLSSWRDNWHPDSIVSLFAVPSYLRYPDRLITRMSAWLRKGGHMTIMPFGNGETGQPDYKLKDAVGRELASEPWTPRRISRVFEDADLEPLTCLPFTSGNFHEGHKELSSPLKFAEIAELYYHDQMLMLDHQRFDEAIFLLGTAVKR